MSKLVEKKENIESLGKFLALIEENAYWNGFDYPLFTKEVADKVMDGINNFGKKVSMRYDESEDVYIRSKVGCKDESFAAVEIEGKKFYAIGSHSWTWTEE